MWVNHELKFCYVVMFETLPESLLDLPFVSEVRDFPHHNRRET